ncbi:uncharacterized protein TEOVI_000319000 [Trypanosoma equiperdum]|uniref:Uncharacterized protein n=2 Tax=Trypanozoon TaxID=39700 RepID=Q38B51_TRYB2|nr:hypothetical protein, conserved [Trypanosoma brucei brucei TREU927]EAN77969.1 hypothetical protein, conserved [Trypanosoma brucei brucei TREU927]SCU71609.1 hypothetical protein, conserved [Trypanosoma equiperdum]
MKARRRGGSLHAELPFTYTLFSTIDVYGDDLLDFTGDDKPERHAEVTEFLRRRGSGACRDAPLGPSSYLHMREPFSYIAEGSISENTSDAGGSFARVEDAMQHVWFISQRDGISTPFALNFSTSAQFLRYAERESLQFPTLRCGSSTMASEPIAAHEGPAKWLDIQTKNKTLVTDILSHFPVSADTVEHCCYPDDMDRVIAHSTLGYFFFNLMCTPIALGEVARGRHQVKSVIQQRLEAAMSAGPRSSTPSAVAVSVIVFFDWVVTVHEEPFHEFDDLLRFILINCGNRAPASNNRRLMQVMTAPFIFASFFQIVVGHLLDSESLTMIVDEVSDLVFLSKSTEGHNEEVVQRITNARRCFAEYAAELTRREYIASVLLHSHMMDSFLTKDKVCRTQIESAQAYLYRMSDEVGDCRDTVALTNWYQNVKDTWHHLQYGNKALRQTVLFTELINIMYPLITLQTLFSLNVRIPFAYYEDQMEKDLKPFFIMMGIVLFFLLLCGRAMYALWHKKHWSTRLLAT